MDPSGRDTIERPEVISEYNYKKIGVDKVDQIESYYNDMHRSYKLWKRIFASLIETASIVLLFYINISSIFQM